jgi:hypothetical protein
MRRHAGRRRLFACVIATAAVLLAPAIARADCADEIIDEVINTGQVTGDYELRCYDQALTRLNPDLEEYGEAPSIIRTAKVAQRDRDREPAAAPPSDDGAGGAGGSDEGAGGEDPSGSPDGEAPADDGTAPEEAGDATSDAASEDDIATGEADETEAGTGDGDWVETGGETVAADAFDDDDGGIAVGPLILGGLAVGLIAVGGGGMVYRKLNER